MQFSPLGCVEQPRCCEITQLTLLPQTDRRFLYKQEAVTYSHEITVWRSTCLFLLVLYFLWSIKQLYNLSLCSLTNRRTHVCFQAHTRQEQTSACRGLNVSLPEHRGWWLMKQCPLCYIKHQHIPALFTDLMHINHLTSSTYRHHIRPPQMEGDKMVWTQRGVGWGDGLRDLEMEEEEKHNEQSQNSTQWNTVRLCPSASQRERERWSGLLAAWLTSFLPLPFCFLPPAYAAFCKAEHTEATRSLKLQRPTGLNSLSNLSGHLKVFQPRYRGNTEKFHIETDERKKTYIKVGRRWRRERGVRGSTWGNLYIYTTRMSYICPDSVFMCF